MQASIPFDSTVYRLLQSMDRIFETQGRYALPLEQRLMQDVYENVWSAVVWTK